MDNIVSMFPDETPNPTNDEIVNDFIDDFVDWARSNEIDTTTVDFKYDAALIMTVLKSLLHSKKVSK